MGLLPEPDEAWAFIHGCAAFVAKPCSLWQLENVVVLVQRGERGLEIATYSEPER